MLPNTYLIEVMEKDYRRRIQKEAENARNLRQIAANSTEDKNNELVILEKLAKVRGRLSAGIKPLRWSFR